MKRKLLVLVFSILHLVSFMAEAQKIRGQKAQTKITHYPIIALPDSFKTYRVEIVELGTTITANKNIGADKIQLKSFQRVSDVADLNIKIIIEKLMIYNPHNGKTINSIDELRGISADVVVNYKLTLRYEVTDRKGIIIQKETFSNNALYTHDAPEPMPTQVQAADIVKNLANYIDNGIVTVEKRLRDLLDTYREPYETEFYTIKASKTESYAAFTAVVEKLEEDFKNSFGDEKNIQKAIHTSIGFWESKLGSFDQSSEDGKEHYFLCTYNLAIAYCLLDDFEKSVDYIERTKKTGVKSGYTTMMQNEVLKRKKYKDQYFAEKAQLAQNPNSIYQKGKVEKGINNISDLKKKPEAASAFMEKGFIVLAKGDSIFGNFIEYDNNLKNGKMLFVENEKEQRTFLQPYSSIQTMSIRGSVFYTTQKGLKRIVYSSPSLVVLHAQHEAIFIFPQQNKNGVYQMFTKDDAANYLTNYKKKLAEAFKGVCPVVEQNALRGDYPLKEEGIQFMEQVIKDFETGCGTKEFEKYAGFLGDAKIQSTYK